MTYTVSYGINSLTTTTSSSNSIINKAFVAKGTSVITTSFKLELNYSVKPTNLTAEYTITAIRIQ